MVTKYAAQKMAKSENLWMSKHATTYHGAKARVTKLANGGYGIKIAIPAKKRMYPKGRKSK